MVRRIVVLATALIFLLLPSVATAARSSMRLSGSFGRNAYVPDRTYRFTLTVRSRAAATNARVSFVILAKLRAGKTLQAQVVSGRRLRKGTTRFTFSGRLRKIGASDGVYPATAIVKAGGVTTRLRSDLVVVDPRRHGRMLVAVVWSVTSTPSVSPRGVYWSRSAPGLVRGGRNPGYLTMHVRKIQRYPRVRVAMNIMPETLTELLGIVSGFRLKDGRKAVHVRSDSPESGDAQAFFSQMLTLLRSGRVEAVPSPFAYPAQPQLAARGWRDDMWQQISTGQDFVERALGSASTAGIFTPQLRLPASAVPMYHRAGADYTVVRGFGGLDTWRAHDIRGASGVRIRTAIADTKGSGMLANGTPSAAVSAFVRHLASVRLTRGRRPSAAVVVLSTDGTWRASPELVERLYRALSETPWIRSVTLGEAVAATYAGRARARLPADRAGSALKPYYSRVERARRSLATYVRMVKPGNPALVRLQRNLLTAESALWIDGGPSGRAAGLVFADDVTRTVAGQLAMMSIPASQTITLPSQSGKVPVTVTNGSRHVVAVDLVLSGTNVDFPEGRTLRMELKPGDNYLTFPVGVRSGSEARVLIKMLGGGTPLGNSVVLVRTTYFSRMMFLAAVIVVLVALLVVVYRKAGASNGR